MQKVTVSIIIVHYKDVRRLFNCLDSIKENKPKIPIEIIVVDNDEKQTINKEMAKKYKWVKYVRSNGNIGYGAGNNLGAQYAQGKYLFILNPDTEILPKAADILTNFLEKNSRVAIVAPNLVDKHGQVFSQLGSSKLTPLRGIVALSFINKLLPNNPVSRTYWLKDVPMNIRREVDVVPGSAFLIRQSVFEKVKGFDERFFLYFEESDLCKRVKELNKKIYIIPEAEIVHYWKKGKTDTQKSKKIFQESRFKYFNKHYGLINALFVELFTRFSKKHALLLLLLTSIYFLFIRKGQ